MSKSDFTRFVTRQQVVRQENEAFNREKRIKEWKEYLDVLYTSIREFMQPYLEDKTAEMKFADLELNEELLGIYAVQKLSLTIGGSNVTFRPIGTILIGGRGRVDVEGPRGTARLVLVNKKVTQGRQLINVSISLNGEPTPPPKTNEEKIELVWKIMSPPPEITFTDLSRDTFFDLILLIAND